MKWSHESFICQLSPSPFVDSDVALSVRLMFLHIAAWRILRVTLTGITAVNCVRDWRYATVHRRTGLIVFFDLALSWPSICSHVRSTPLILIIAWLCLFWYLSQVSNPLSNEIRRILQLSVRFKLLRYSWHRFGLPNRKRLTPPSARHNHHVCFSSVWWTVHLMKLHASPAVVPRVSHFRPRFIVSYFSDDPCTGYHVIMPLLTPVFSLELDIWWDQLNLSAVR